MRTFLAALVLFPGLASATPAVRVPPILGLPIAEPATPAPAVCAEVRCPRDT